ncbi:GIY-YIG nuclease family protein [Candidatus Saccharibacteria bacterium]|nr:GIY-YIG nuclease family protein [Candidatus Saccharibacteria bacterium]
MYQIYVLYNSNADRIYIGQTNDLEARLKSHNEKLGNHFTAKFQGDWKLIYTESALTRAEALRREKQLKTSRGRAFLKQYIPIS